MNKYVSALLVCPALIFFSLLTGCATIVSGTTQSVLISTPQVNNATCSLTNSEGKWYIPYTPSTIVVHQSNSALDIVCQKAGYYDGNDNIKSHLKPIVFGNLLLGGVIGVAIDAIDGAAFRYPVNIEVPLMPKANQ